MTALRSSGIPLMDDVQWGAHLCLFYEGLDDLFDGVSLYFEAGIEGNELCVWRLPIGTGIDEAREKLRPRIEDFDAHFAEGRIQLSSSVGPTEPIVLERFWLAKFDEAVVNGFEGLRGCGDSDALSASSRPSEYERGLHVFLENRPALALCTYSMSATSAMDVFDIMRVHNLSVARRAGEWQFMETPELQRANAHIRNLADALVILSTPFPGHELLTERERMVLAYVVKGASSKEAGRELGISPRTVDFHRANIIEKLGARNTADAVRRVLSRR